MLLPPAAMNAPNPLTPDPRPLSAQTVEQLRQAILNRRQSPALGDDALRRALEAVAAEARQRDLRPEELIVTLKQIVDEAPGARLISGDDRRLREWIVSTCIRAYFDAE
jgi:hypothetical protein